MDTTGPVVFMPTSSVALKLISTYSPATTLEGVMTDE
jgi:hypothetical protein